MSRKTAREVAMKLAFARLFGCEDTYGAVLDKSGITETPKPDDVKFADELLCGVEEKKEEIDGLISEFAVDWTIERMPKVDLSILRIAVYEIMYRCDIPDSVSINEAVELAKKYEGEKTPGFINGILNASADDLGLKNDDAK